MMLLLITFAVFGAVACTAYGLLVLRGAPALSAQARLERIAGQSPYPDWGASSLALRTNRMSSIAFVERMLANRDFALGLDLTITRAGWRMRVSEFLATCFLAGVFGFFAVKLALGYALVGAIVGLFAMYIPYFLLRRAAKKRIGKIENQLAETLSLMANALRAGFGLMQAIGQAAKQTEDPIAGELNQLMRDIQIGSSVEEAVTEFGRRIGSYDLDIVVTAILVQRNVGGNLSEILDGVAHTIRERERIRGEIQTLIAEQKMTGMVIALVPPGVAILFFLLNKAYMMTLVTTGVGKMILVAAVVLELLGAWMIKKIISIDV
jgi:tight adherence protein B